LASILLLVGWACVDLTPPDAVLLVDHFDAGMQEHMDAAVEMPTDGPGESSDPDGPTDQGGGGDVVDEPPPLMLSKGLIGYWKLDMLNTNSTPDSSGNGNFASILGGPTVVTTQSQLPSAIKFTNGGAFQFMQVDAGLTAPNTAQLPTREITVATWVKFSN